MYNSFDTITILLYIYPLYIYILHTNIKIGHFKSKLNKYYIIFERRLKKKSSGDPSVDTIFDDFLTELKTVFFILREYNKKKNVNSLTVLQ